MAVLAAAAAGCASGPHSGRALVSDGPQAGATVGIEDAVVGDRVMFALPAFHNTSDKAVRIKDVALRQVPAGVKVLGYRSMSFKDSDGMMLTWSERTAGKDIADALQSSTDGVDGIVVPPNSVGSQYALVMLQILAPLSGDIKDDVVTYEQDGKQYRQTMSATWAIEMRKGAAP